MKVTLQDIQSAEKVIQNIVVKTPCSYSFSTSELIGTNVFFVLIELLASSVKFTLFDAGYGQVAQNTVTTNIPATSTSLRVVAVITTQDDATKTMSHYFAHQWNKYNA